MDDQLQQMVNFSIERAWEHAGEHGSIINIPFESNQIKKIYTLKYHTDEAGDGLWFELKNGAVYNLLGLKENISKSCYEDPLPETMNLEVSNYVIQKMTAHQLRLEKQGRNGPVL